MLKSTYLCGGSLLVVVMMMGAAGPAVAAAAAAAAGPTTVEEVVVTGSFIAGTPTDAALPVDVINSEQLEKQGSPSTLDLLKSLPTSSGILGETNQFDPRAQGSEGSGSVNLRGLGAQRTLVLINGHRMTPNPFGQGGAGIVDTNIIPSAAIGRVEVLKDGAAATYGSDAIAGVVNFITRKNVEGLEVGGSYRYIDGSDGDYTANLLWGHIFDHGDVLLSAGYQHRSQLKTTDRDWAIQPYLNDPEGGWSGGNAIAPFIPIFQNGAGAWGPAAGFKLDAGCAALGGVPVGGALPACNFHYTPYDNLVEKEDRFQLYAEANAELGEDAKLHVEALYSETQVPEWHTSPSYLALQTSTALTNPEVGTLTSAVLAGYFVPSTNPGFIAYQAAHPGDIPAFATAVHIPGVRYRPIAEGGNPFLDDGSSVGRRHYDAYRVSADLTGKFSFGIGYDFTATYSEETGIRTGYDTVVSLFQLALRGYGSLAHDGGNGCTAAKTSNYTTGAGNAALGCYYFNPFSNSTAKNSITGQTNPEFSSALANNPDLVRWFFRQGQTEATERLFVVDAVFNGVTGIHLSGGDVAWAAGVQYRNNGYVNTLDNLSNIAATPCIDTPVNGNTSCAVQNGPLMFLGTGSEADLSGDVYAGFGELSVPFTDSLQLQLAARYEDYGGQTGSTFNPKGALRWQVTDWLAFRGSAGSTFRGPPLTQLVNNSVTALSFIAGSFRAIDIFGNPNLAPEKANTYSLGAIFNFGKLKGTIDWWRFDFNNPIVAEPSGAMVATMFPGNSSVNCGVAAFAGLQARFSFQGACGVAAIARVRTLYVNGPSVQTSGVDAQGDYDFGDFLSGRLKVGGGLTYTLEYKTDAFSVGGVSVQPAYDAAGLLNYQLAATSLPQLKGQAYVEYTNGPHNLRWTVKYVSDYHDQRADVPGAGIVAVNAVSGQVITAGSTIRATWTHNLDYRLLLPSNTTLTVGVENIFDQDPAFARLDLNYDPFTGDPLGRTIKVGLKKKF